MTTYTDLKARLGRMEAITMPGQPFTLETVKPWLEKNAEIRREALAAIEELEGRTHSLENSIGWYGHQARMCRRHGKEGDEARHALSEDGGKRAIAALKGEPQ